MNQKEIERMEKVLNEKSVKRADKIERLGRVAEICYSGLIPSPVGKLFSFKKYCPRCGRELKKKETEVTFCFDYFYRFFCDCGYEWVKEDIDYP